MTPKDRIIVALDVPRVDEARALIGKLGDSVEGLEKALAYLINSLVSSKEG